MELDLRERLPGASGMERFTSASGTPVNEACVSEVRTFTAANALRFFSAFVIAASAGRISRRCFFPRAFRAATISSRVRARGLPQPVAVGALRGQPCYLGRRVEAPDDRRARPRERQARDGPRRRRPPRRGEGALRSRPGRLRREQLRAGARSSWGSAESAWASASSSARSPSAWTRSFRTRAMTSPCVRRPCDPSVAEDGQPEVPASFKRG